MEFSRLVPIHQKLSQRGRILIRRLFNEYLHRMHAIEEGDGPPVRKREASVLHHRQMVEGLEDDGVSHRGIDRILHRLHEEARRPEVLHVVIEARKQHRMRKQLFAALSACAAKENILHPAPQTIPLAFIRILFEEIPRRDTIRIVGLDLRAWRVRIDLHHLDPP